MTRILSDLNPEQREAVTYGVGPLLIFAGAGSGKTRVLTHRIAYLIRECGVRPGNVLAVTFTNKAANEMRERIQALIGSITRGMWVGTFHSICARILRVHGERVGVDPKFVVFDTGDQQSLMKQCLEELNLDAKRYKPQDILSLISNAKNELIAPRTFETNAKGFYEQITAKAYYLYEKKLRLNRACDFDDLLCLTVQLLHENQDVADQYQERFQHVLVDEYQDINFAQYKLVDNIARKYRNICVVGDDDQSIYAWRGADVRLILQFEKDYPDAKVVKLEQNYRSTQIILDAAHAVIRRNEHRKPKKLWTARKGGNPIILQETANELEEAQYVVEKINEFVSANRARFDSSDGSSEGQHGALRTRPPEGREQGSSRYSDFAILYRTNAQSRALEEVFVKHHVPYRLVGAVQFYQRKEIKDIVAYLKVIYNPYDTVSLRRIINVPHRGIGAKTLESLEDEAVRRNCTVTEVLELIAQTADGSRQKAEGSSLPPATCHLPPAASLLSPRVTRPVREFVKLLHALRSHGETENSVRRYKPSGAATGVRYVASEDSDSSIGDRIGVTELVKELLELTGYARELEEEHSLDAAERLENLKEFLSATQEFDEQMDAELDQSDTVIRPVWDPYGLDGLDELDEFNEFEPSSVRVDARHPSAPMHRFEPSSVRGDLERAEFASPVTSNAQSSRGQSPLTTLGAFLETVALVSDVDKLDEDANAVTLMTLHSAKGLEFPIVFLVGMEEDILPHARSKFDQKGLEEERRLCYVGLTRAREQVHLTFAHRRTIYGLTADTRVSQFVKEIPAGLINRNSRSYSFRDLPAVRQADLGDAWGDRSSPSLPLRDTNASRPPATRHLRPVTCDDFRVGDKVRHGKWGEGIIVKASGNGEKQEWVEVAFPRSDVGIKKLMLEYAPLEKVP